MNRFNGSASVPSDGELAHRVLGELGECCHCGCGTMKLWFATAKPGHRIARACSIEHLSETYPQYTTDTTDWE